MVGVEKLIGLIPDKKTRNVAFTATGFAALVTGQKVVSLGLLGKGLKGLEECWREAHPSFHGGFGERWQMAVDHYEATHQNTLNRRLHVLGIPMIAGGTLGLLLFNPYRPLWLMSATSFAAGWALNVVGHQVYEHNAPAFSQDPLAFVAGPVWDVQQLLQKRRGRNGRHSQPVTVEVVNVGGATATA